MMHISRQNLGDSVRMAQSLIRTRKVAAIVGSVLIALLTASPTFAATPTTQAKGQRCVVQLAPLTDEDRAARRASRVVSQRCSTDGTMPQLAASEVALIQFYDYTNYQGGQIVFTGSNCSGSYSVADMAAYGFGDRAESFSPYCGRQFGIFEYDYYQGRALGHAPNVNIPDMGSFNNVASSWYTT